MSHADDRFARTVRDIHKSLQTSGRYCEACQDALIRVNGRHDVLMHLVGTRARSSVVVADLAWQRIGVTLSERAGLRASPASSRNVRHQWADLVERARL